MSNSATILVPTILAPTISESLISISGDFTGHPQEEILKNMYDAITTLKLWKWLETFVPEANKGLMFSDTPEIEAITHLTASMGHSGWSFAFSLNHMSKIAKLGWPEYYRIILAIARNAQPAV